MRTGPLVHGILLAIALVFAYKTWTREDKPEPKTGDVEIWTKPVAKLTSASFESDRLEVKIERRGEGADSYLWGSQTRITKKPAPPKPPKPEPEPAEDAEDAEAKDAEAKAADGEDAEAKAADGEATEAAAEPEPEPEVIRNTREFAVGDAGDELVEHLAALRALVDLGVVDEERKAEYGLDDGTDMLTVVFDDGARSLILGSKVQGGIDRYALDPDSGRGYVLAGAVVNPLEVGETKLRLDDLHGFDDENLAGAVVKVGEQSRELVHIEQKNEQGMEVMTWAAKASPDKADQTMANFIKRVRDLQPSSYEPELDTKELELLVSVSYTGKKGENLGTFELYKKTTMPEPEPAEATPGEPAAADPAAPAGKDAAKPGDATKPGDPAAAAEAKPEPPRPAPQPVVEYYLRTDRTRVPAAVAKPAAERIDQDLPQIFGK